MTPWHKNLQDNSENTNKLPKQNWQPTLGKLSHDIFLILPKCDGEQSCYMIFSWPFHYCGEGKKKKTPVPKIIVNHWHQNPKLAPKWQLVTSKQKTSLQTIGHDFRFVYLPVSQIC